MDHQPLFSIIVPVYNVEKYLVECLESIVNQTFDDYEVLLIDDGSTDKSGCICDEYAEKYSQAKVYHKQNGGQSSARNLGITKSLGKYIVFVDSDDWIDKNLLKSIFEYTGKYDVVFWSYCQEFSDRRINKHLYYESIEFSYFDSIELRRENIGPVRKETKSPLLLDKHAPVWNKLYSSKIIKDNALFFDDINCIGTFEDGLFNFRYFKYVESAYYLDNCLYHYRKTNSNSSTSICRTDLLYKWDNLYQIILDTINYEKLGDDYLDSLNNRVAISVFMIASILVNSDYSKNESINCLKDVMSKDLYCNAINNLELHGFSFLSKCYYHFVKQKKYSLILFLNNIIRIASRIVR